MSLRDRLQAVRDAAAEEEWRVQEFCEDLDETLAEYTVAWGCGRTVFYGLMFFAGVAREAARRFVIGLLPAPDAARRRAAEDTVADRMTEIDACFADVVCPHCSRATCPCRTCREAHNEDHGCELTQVDVENAPLAQGRN